MNKPLPYLYSFRRCPYAIRARLGILFANLEVELREVSLKDKPEEMLKISPKGTVPVLDLGAQVIDESLDIIKWALHQSDSSNLLKTDLPKAYELIKENDNEFKYWLDRYKYFVRFPEQTQAEYLIKCEVFLQKLEKLLTNNKYLMGEHITIADIAIMPFLRQFSSVDKNIFHELPYPFLQDWLKLWLDKPQFKTVMVKYKPWKKNDNITVFPSPN